MSAASWRRLPKVELHLHVAGSARPATLAELGGPVVAPLLADYAEAAVGEGLARYLGRFSAFNPAVDRPKAIARVMAELAEDLLRDGVAYAEARVRVPDTAGDDGHWDAFLEAAVEATRAARRHGGPWLEVIVVTLRTWPAERVLREARRAARWAGCGVVGFDVSGDESRGCLRDLQPAVAVARAAGLGITLHAGEGRGAEAVAATLDLLAPDRIAHGVRGAEDPAVEARLAALGTHLEVAVTSNLQTGAVPHLAHHPAGRWAREGRLSFGLNTDNRTVSGVTLSGELDLAERSLGMTHARLAARMRQAAAAAFLPAAERTALLAEIERGWAQP